MNKKTIIAIVAVLVLVVALAAIWALNKPAAQVGGKTITVEIRYDGNARDVVFQTDAENLADALKEQNLIEGNDSEYGIYITTVDGRVADGDAHEFWGIYKNGEMTPTGADTTMIANGEHYELVLETW